MNCLLLECRRRGNSSFELGKFQQMGSGRGIREMYSTSAIGYSVFVVCFGRGHLVVINHSCQNAVLNREFHMAWRHVEV